MASQTRKLKVRRKLAKVSSGKKAKNLRAKYGSTAKDLPLNMPNAQEKAIAAAKNK